MPRLQFWRGREAWSHMWACCVSSRLWWMCWTDADLCLGSVTATTGLMRKHPSSWQRETPLAWCCVWHTAVVTSGAVGIKLCLCLLSWCVGLFHVQLQQQTPIKLNLHAWSALFSYIFWSEKTQPQLWDMYKKLLQYPFFGRCCTLLQQNLLHSTFWGLIAIILS